MGKFKTSKNILRNKSFRKKSIKKKLLGGGEGAKVEEVAKVQTTVEAAKVVEGKYTTKFKQILKYFDSEFKTSMCQAYSFSPNNVGFFDKDGNPRDETLVDEFSNIDKIVEKTHEKLGKWNECLNLTKSDTPEENVNTGKNPKPEKLFILSDSHASYKLDDTNIYKKFTIPNNIITCFLSKEGQTATYFPEDIKSWLSIADYDDEKFEELFKLKIKNTTHTFDNSYDYFTYRHSCFQESSWFYPGQECYNMTLSYNDTLIKTMGLYIVRPGASKEPKSNRRHVITQGPFREGKRLFEQFLS